MDADGEPIITILGPPSHGQERNSVELEDGNSDEDWIDNDDANSRVVHSGGMNESGDSLESSWKTLTDGEEDDEEVNAALLRAKMYIRTMEQQDEREKREWLIKKQQQLKARQEKAKNSNNSINNQSPVLSHSTSPSNDIPVQDESSLSWEKQKQKISQIALKALDEHRRIHDVNLASPLMLDSSPYNAVSSNSNKRFNSLPISRTRNRPGKPTSRSAIIEWFRDVERPKGVGREDGSSTVATWFHGKYGDVTYFKRPMSFAINKESIGMISRQEAERILMCHPVGTFLVRVSERIWGYAISYRAQDRCKHFLIDAASGFYQFFGDGNMSHTSIGELVEYHKTCPVTELGQEFLQTPCPQPGIRPNYWELFN